jgi:hypothetical protein
MPKKIANIVKNSIDLTIKYVFYPFLSLKYLLNLLY